MQNKGAYLRGQRFSTSCLVIALVCLLLLLAACGTNGGTLPTTTGSGSGTTPTAASTATTGSSGATKTPARPLATQSCGIIHTLRLLIVPADVDRVKGVEDCFWQAYQQCHPATLIYSQGSLDSGTLHTFSLKSSSGKCVITDGVQHYVVPHPPQAAITYTCTGLTRSADGLHFTACGQAGDVFVPSGGVI